MQQTYDPSQVEANAQQHWKDQLTFATKEELTREKFYCLAMLPYPSGQLHMGHVRNYTISDVIARYERQCGKNVLQPMGWDAFGLPAENAAIQNKLPPSTWTRKNITKMRKHFQQLGYAIDWQREFATCDPTYYHWEQWLFVQLHTQGLVYKKLADVNWDPIDQTVLANEQVVNGRGWRSNAPVERRRIPQWFFRITDYAEELLNGLDELEHWPEQVKVMQRNWIGRSEGTTLYFDVLNPKQSADSVISVLNIYTTRPDTLMGVTYLGIAAEHPLAIQAAADHPAIADFIEQCRHTGVAEAELALQEKCGIETPFTALHPITGESLPIWITNFVLMEYGEGAVMAVPAHDERDYAFAKQYELPCRPVIAPADGQRWDYAQQGAYILPGNLIDSGEFTGLSSQDAKRKITEYLVEQQRGFKAVHYRLRDWGISRQRYWGTPIPIIYCPECGDVPVPVEQLPVVLPDDLIPDGHGSPLTHCPEFYETTCPRCGGEARRETDTMDTFVESSWYYARYCCPNQTQSMLDDRAKYWTPVDQYVGGIEHAVMHLLYARFMHKVLRDQGLLNTNEPFKRLLTQGMVLKDGAKMSKSKGNVVAPQPLIKKYGADTVRFFSMFASPPTQSLEWSDSGVDGASRFLHKVWALAYQLHAQWVDEPPQEDSAAILADDTLKKHYQTLHQLLQQATQDMQRQQFNTVAAACMKLLNLLSQLDPERTQHHAFFREGMGILIRILAPITPHLCHHLWQVLDYGDNILTAGWPKVNTKALHTDEVTLVVQVNGKRRGNLTVPADADQNTVETHLTQHIDDFEKYWEGKTIKRIIVVPNRLVNIVVA